ncbi:DUF3649 domain-containing protein [Arenimonas fontis]|uniref:DUF3649 domain-containing protein n=1 Tax=Arenimonas fontis TaxID=2608255 RepID=UPI001AED9E8D|nr:DUF3649 domain-containing protein [Arenimonas fontis]
MASRTGAAVLAGYFLAWGCTAFLTAALPLAKVDRVVFASLPSFALWCVAAVYAFAARSAWRAWAWPLGLGLALLLPVLLFPQWGARP